MEPINRNTIAALDVKAALRSELATARNLLPPEPWIGPIKKNVTSATRWIIATMERGGRMLPSVTVNARKAGNGVRPVPIVGIAERVIYRILCDASLEGLTLGGRGAAEYRQMLRGPVDAAFLGQRPFTLRDAEKKYVVESDLASFYQYIDHEVLKAEIQLQTGEVQFANLLVALLSEVEQRHFGLPQLLDSSDRLSEVYAQIIERDLVRSGLLVWRYNDDFRISVDGNFSHALQAIERLAESARAVGLTLNESKTRTPSLMTYLWNNTNLKIDDKEIEIDPQDVELIITDYVIEDEEDQIIAAEETLQRLASSHDEHIDLKNATSPDIRDLRRAINALARNKNPGGLDVAFRLFMFVPSLTPRIIHYLIQLAPSASMEVGAIFDRLIASRNTSDWQRIWLIYAGRTLNLFFWHTKRTEWVKEQRFHGQGSLLGAESALALAGVQESSMPELDRAIRMEPEVLAPWYVMAMGLQAGSSPSAADVRVLNAVRSASPLYRMLLK